MRGAQVRLLFAYLASTSGRSAARDELVDGVWPDRAPADPHARLRPLLSRLRRVIGPAALEGREHVRLLLPEPVWSDVEGALAAVAAARAAAERGDWEQAMRDGRRGADLLAARFLAEHDGDWIEARRRELADERLDALEVVARAGLVLRGAQLAVARSAAREMIESSPYREAAWRLVMEVLEAEGNVAEALEVYERLRCRLRDDLGAVPSAQSQRLHARMLAGGQPRRTGVLPSALSPRERSPFLGRAEQLERIAAAWRRATEGEAQIVFISGEPGIGKTRLCAEFAEVARAQGATVLRAACQEEALIPYEPLVQALRQYALGRPEDLPPARLGAGANELVRLVPELAGAVEAVDDLGTVDPATRRYLMFEAMSALLDEASTQASLLVLLDDLHWADRSTVSLLRHLVRAQQPASRLILATYRGAELAPGHALADLVVDLRREQACRRLALPGLDEESVGGLVAAYIGEPAPDAFVQRLHAETEGNPFFIEEVVRHLIEAGVGLDSASMDRPGIPQGVQEVIGQRLARLSIPSKAALSRGAILGREFAFATLQAMSEADEEALLPSLEEAAAAQLLVETQPRGEPCYRFTHALVRDVLYAGLSGPRRQRLHAQAARAIEHVGGDDAEDVAALALHHRLAGREGDPARAVEYSLRAGEQAREGFAWDEAMAHWDSALAAMESLGSSAPARARLLEALSSLAFTADDPARTIRYLETALALHDEAGQVDRAARVHSRIGLARANYDAALPETLNVPEALAHLRAARQALIGGAPSRAEGWLEIGEATAMMATCRIDRGAAASERALEIARSIDDRALESAGLTTLGWHRMIAGRPDAGLEAFDAAWALADELSLSSLAWAASVPWIWAYGDVEALRQRLELGLARSYMGETRRKREFRNGIGLCHAARGEMAEARRLLSDADYPIIHHRLEQVVALWDGRWSDVESFALSVLEASRAVGLTWGEWGARFVAAQALHLAGESARAADMLNAAHPIAVDSGAGLFEMWSRPLHALACVELGRLDEARSHVGRCREILARGEDWRARAASVEVADGAVLGEEGRVDEAETHLRRALEIFERYRLPCEQALLMETWGRVLASGGDLAGAGERLDAALDLYHRHDAGLPRLERVRAQRAALGMG